MELPLISNIKFDIGKNQFIHEYFKGILKRLDNNEKISILEREKIKYYMNLVNQIPHDEKNNLEQSIFQEKIRILNEKISQIITKGEFNVVDDKLNNIKRHSEGINQEDQIQYKGNVDLNMKRRTISNLLSDKYDEFITTSNSLSDLMVFSSNEFLKNQLNMSVEEIIKLKSKGDPYEELHELLDNEILNKCDYTTPLHKDDVKKKENYVEIIKKEAENVKKALIDKNNNNLDRISRTNLEKNVEEDLQNEVFHLVKGMNKYARNFTNILESDNKTLSQIENIQQQDKSKTTKQLGNLKEFQFNIKIGWIQLILMFCFVIISFFMTLIAIRIFPVLV